jgi:hypothetical protein
VHFNLTLLFKLSMVIKKGIVGPFGWCAVHA